MRILRNKPLIIALAGLAIAISVHLINGKLSGLPWGIHATADDASYLRPVENWLATGTWKDNSVGASSYVQRPPLFGVIHGFFYLLFGKHAAIATLLFFFTLHAFALYRLTLTLRHFFSERTALRLAWVYAVLPCFWGFLSYQITEAVSPSLAILLLSVLLRPGKYSIAWAIVLFTALWFLRPVLVLLFPLFFYFLWQKRRELFDRSAWWNTVIGTCALLLVLSWEYRKALYIGSWGELHPIYHASNNSPFRPAHASLSDVFRVWETRPEAFHAIVGACWSDDSTMRSLHFLENYVANRSVPLSAAELHTLLSDYHDVNAGLRVAALSGELTHETAPEIAFRHRMDALADTLRANNGMLYHVKTPIRSATEQLTKSQLNLELFQVFYRGNIFIEVLRWLCLLVILVLFTGSALALFSKNPVLRWLSAGILLYCFYLFYVQRMNEDRYLIPLLPVLFVTGCVLWRNAFSTVLPERSER